MNTTELQKFSFNELVLETITDNNGEVWFLATPLAKFLDYKNPAEAIRTNVDNDEVQKIYIPTKSNSYTFINESGLYSLVFRSNKPEAKAFKKWVTNEVLPTIRKTGAYSLQPKVPTSYLEALVALVQSETEKQSLQNKIETDKPKVEFAEAIRNTDGKVSVGDFAKVIGTGQNRLFERLRNDGFLMANNRPYQHSIDRELLVSIEQKPHVDNNGKSHPSFKTLITGKGQVYFEKRYRKDVL